MLVAAVHVAALDLHVVDADWVDWLAFVVVDVVVVVVVVAAVAVGDGHEHERVVGSHVAGKLTAVAARDNKRSSFNSFMVNKAGVMETQM